MRIRMSVVLSFFLLFSFLLAGCSQTITPAPATSILPAGSTPTDPPSLAPAPDDRFMCTANSDRTIWDCTKLAGRTAIFSQVSPELQVYAYPIKDNKALLNERLFTNNVRPLSLVADFRFYADGKPQSEFKQPILFSLELTPEDIKLADTKTIGLVQINPEDGKGWKLVALPTIIRADDKTKTRLMDIYFTKWQADPATSPGVGN